MKVYIEPASDWHLDYNLVSDSSKLNFTWKVTQLDSEMMKLKLNFTDPLVISPFIKYDKLAVVVDDLANLFEQSTPRMRMLQTEAEVVQVDHSKETKSI